MNEPAPAARPKLLLCLTLGEDLDALRACLNAALPRVDGYALGHAGDAQPATALARSVLAERTLPGALLDLGPLAPHERRTACAAGARAWAGQQG